MQKLFPPIKLTKSTLKTLQPYFEGDITRHKAVSYILSLKLNNRQHVGDALQKISYSMCLMPSWRPMVLFKLGYLQALIDTKQRVDIGKSEAAL